MSTAEQPRFTLDQVDGASRLSLHLGPGASVSIDLSADEIQELRDLLAGWTSSDDHPAPESHLNGDEEAPAVPSAPEPAPVFSTQSGDQDLDAAPTRPEDLKVLPAVTPHLERLGLTRDDLVTIIDDPEDEWVDASGRRAIVVRGETAVVLSLRDQAVLSVQPASRARESRPQDTPRFRTTAAVREPGIRPP